MILSIVHFIKRDFRFIWVGLVLAMSVVVALPVFAAPKEEPAKGICKFTGLEGKENFCVVPGTGGYRGTKADCDKFCSGAKSGSKCEFVPNKTECPAGSTTTTPNQAKSAVDVIPLIPLENPLRSNPKNIPGIIGGVMERVLSVVGALALLVFVFGGFMWLTSGGAEDKVKKGTQSMLYAVIGLFIIFASYGILQVVIRTLTQ